MKTLDELQQEYDLLNEKINRLRKAKIIETDTADLFKLEHQIKEAEEEREQIAQKLEIVENGGIITDDGSVMNFVCVLICGSPKKNNTSPYPPNSNF